MIKSMDFVRVVSDKKLKGSGLKRGDTLLITGTKVVPIKKSDPYLQRILVVGVLLKDEELLLPAEGKDHKAYLVDPRNLEKVGEDEVNAYEALIKTQYGRSS